MWMQTFWHLHPSTSAEVPSATTMYPVLPAVMTHNDNNAKQTFSKTTEHNFTTTVSSNTTHANSMSDIELLLDLKIKLKIGVH